MRMLLVVGITVLARTAVAQATADCATTAHELRAHLTREARAARGWNLGWGIGFGVAAVGQFAIAATEPFELDTKTEESLYVGAAKSVIGAGARFVLPLRVAVPVPQDDACADVTALRAAVAKAARRERRTMLLTLFGGTALNLAGAALLWQRHDLATGATSFAIGLTVGVISAYTAPRGSWRLWSEQRATWTVGIGRVPGAPRSLSVGGAF